MVSTYRQAPKEGNIMAPPDFIRALREDTGCHDLTCWWEPDGTRTITLDDGTKKDLKGCWVIFVRIDAIGQMNIRGVEVQYIHDMWVEIYRLDGEYGCPTGLGGWVARALNQADNTKRGYGVRQKELNDINERKYLQPREQHRQFMEEFYKDSFTKRVHQMHADKFGVTLRTKEDIDILAKQAEEAQRKMWEENYRAAKEMRVYQEN